MLLIAVLFAYYAVYTWLIPSTPSEIVKDMEELPFSGWCTNPTWSPDGSRIAYERSRDIYIVDWDGGNGRWLVEGIDDARDPVWSPDGSKIAFIMEGRIESISPDGDSRETLMVLSELMDPLDPSISSLTWSPDGSMLVFEMSLHVQDESEDSMESGAETNDDIWVFAIDSGDLRQLTTHPESDRDPMWNPDSQRIAFISDRAGDHWDIWVTDIEGNELWQLTTNPGLDWEPSWSPDGTQIAFASGHDTNIWVMDADGSNKRQLTESSADNHHPAWNPNGSMIAFDSTSFGPVGDIWLMHSDGSEKTRLTDASRFKPSFSCNSPWIQYHTPMWSPDGTKILFIEGTHDGHTVIQYDGFWVMELQR